MDGGEEPFFKRRTRYLDTAMRGLRHFEYAVPDPVEEPWFYRAAPANRPRRRPTGPMDHYRDASRRRVGEGEDDFGGEEGMEAVAYVPAPAAAVGPPLPDSPPEGMDIFEHPDQVDVMGGQPGDAVRLVRRQAVTSLLENLPRWQDKQSNNFSYFTIRGGLPNFQLLDAPAVSNDIKFHITQYVHYVLGETTPRNPSAFILPFGFGNGNTINPNATSCQYLSGLDVNYPLVRIQYGCLNAVSMEVTSWPSEVRGGWVGFGYYRNVPISKDYGAVNPIPNEDALPDPEHCFPPNAQFYSHVDLSFHPLTNARYTWPYDPIYHRTSSSISMYNLRISGSVRAQEYRRQILATEPLINGVYWANLVRYIRPIIYIVVFLERQSTREGHVDFDDVVDGVGMEASTLQVPMGQYVVPANAHDSVPVSYNSTVPRRYMEIPNDCEVLAFECIDLSGKEDSYNTARYVTAQPAYEYEVPGVVVVPGQATATWSAVDMPFEERPFVFDIDLNGLVVNFRKNNFNYFKPTILNEHIGISMLTNNSLHIAAYCQYPGMPVSQSFDLTEPTAERLTYCQPISIGYTSHLTFKDFVD